MVACDSLSLTSCSFFSRFFIKAPPVFTRRKVTICPCSSFIRVR